jgi:hypothetical protein
LELPSGNVCLVKRPGLPQLLSANVLPDLLTPIAQSAIAMGQNGTVSSQKVDEEIKGILKSEEGLASLLESFARVTAFCVIEPKCKYHKRKVETVRMDGVDAKWEDIPEDEREQGTLYTDIVDMDDQMFIFNFVVGGSSDLTQFRAESGQSLGGVEDVTVPKEISG